MGKNLQWWRFLSYSRAQLNNTFSPRVKFSLVGNNYTRVLLPSRLGATALTVPALSIPLQQDPLTPTIDRMTLVASEFFGWFELMGNRHGASLLSLLVLGYWIQGFRCFPWLAMSFYLKDGLQVDTATLQFWQSTVNLPRQGLQDAIPHACRCPSSSKVLGGSTDGSTLGEQCGSSDSRGCK